MKYLLAYCFCIPLMLLHAYSQSNLYDLPKIIPITPNAAAFEKFSVTPVNYATGIPDISYPFWNWSKGRLSFNIGLSYHAGGHKVDDMASNVGLGWTITGLGRVTRSVRGLPDDDVTKGFMYTPILPQVSTYNYDGGYYFSNAAISTQTNVPVSSAITPYNASYSDTIRQINENQLDGEQDIFSFSVNGSSGRFVFDKNKTVVPLEYTNCRIEPQYGSYVSGQPHGYIISFKITDDKGLVYRFEQKELQVSQTYSSNDMVATNSTSNTQSVTSGWLLTKIIDPLANDSVVIHYTDNMGAGVQYETGYSESQTYELEHADHQYERIVAGVKLTSDIFNFLLMGNNDPQASSIDFPDGSRLNFTYGFGREDLVNSNALTSIKASNLNNQLIKWYEMQYGYFTTSTGTVPPHTTGNNFFKRLKLTGINEISSDSAVVKPTSFTYDNLEINNRGSKNVDFWGYNVNPGRNNPYYVPVIKLDESDYNVNPLYGRYLDGANRSPDSTYAKAGILERIDYPTGGFTTFEYECNRAYSATDYYENTINISSLEWYKTAFGQSQSLVLTDRTSTSVSLLLKTVEFSPRPTHVPGGTQSCLDTQQDDQIASFTITSTDNAFSTTVTDTYGHFAGGITAILELPLGKTYTISFSYDASSDCYYQYPFKASAGGKYYIAPQDKLAGGLRIRKITYNAGNNSTVIKQYNYNDITGHSSAQLDVIPNFGYYRTGVDETIYAMLHTRHVNRTSNPTNTLNYFNGSPIVYKRVQEQELDGSLTEKQFDPIVSASNGGNGFYPYLPWQDFQNQSGLLKTMIIKDKDGVAKNTHLLHYNKTQDYHLNPQNRNIKTGNIATGANYTTAYYAADQYFMYTSNADQTADTLITYENGASLNSIHNRFYNSLHYLDSSITTDSKNKLQTTGFLYTGSFAGTAIYDNMISKNMIGQLIQQTNYLDHSTIKSVKSNYTDWGNNILAPQTIQVQNGMNAIETRLEYHNYDNKGNVLEVAKKDDAVHAYIYDYANTYPVAETVNAPYASIAYTSFESDGKGNWDYADGAVTTDGVTGSKSFNLNGNNIQRTALSSGTTYTVTYWLKNSSGTCSLGGTALINKNGWTLYTTDITSTTTLTITGTGTIDELRLYPRNAQMTTYTYAPLIGMTSQCDVNNKISYYEYDGFGRLLRIRDMDRNILQSFQYTYKEAQ